MPPKDRDLLDFKFDLDWMLDFIFYKKIYNLKDLKTSLICLSYGYSGIEGKKNLVSVPFTNEIAYSAGSIIVLYNLEKKRQRHYREHTSHVNW